MIALGGDSRATSAHPSLARPCRDLRTHLKENDTVTAMIINVDRKNRSINLSIKAKDNADEGEAMPRIAPRTSGANTGTTNLGALLKAKLDTKIQQLNALGGERRMTKSELIDRLAAQFPQLVAKDAELAVKMILDAMAESLAKGSASRSAGSAASDSTTARRAPDATRSRARRCRCRKSTSRISRRARSCGSGWTSQETKRTDGGAPAFGCAFILR